MSVLSVPTFFSEVLSVDARRKYLLDAIGDIDIEDILQAMDPEESEDLAELLTNDKTVADVKKAADAQKAAINKSMKEIPARIKELELQKSSIQEPPSDETIQALKQQKESLEKDLAIKSVDHTLDIREALIDLKATNAEAKGIHDAAESAKSADLLKEIDSLTEAVRKAESESRNLTREWHDKVAERDKLSLMRQSMISEYKKVCSQKWDEGSEVCPTCGQKLPLNEIEEMKKTFNKNKSAELEKINARGHDECSQEMLSGIEKDIEKTKENIELTNKNIVTTTEILNSKKAQIIAPIPYEETNAYKTYEKKRLDLEQKLREKSVDNNEIQALKTKISDLNNAINDAVTKQAEAQMQDKLDARIDELKAEETTAAESYELAEYHVHLTESFMKAQVDALTTKINEKFESVSFQLYEEQINGGLKPTCEAMVPNDKGILVPYSTANFAGKINAGLEIIDVLSKAWGWALPVVIDGTESIADIKHIESQIICLEVDKTMDKTVGNLIQEVLTPQE